MTAARTSDNVMMVYTRGVMYATVCDGNVEKDCVRPRSPLVRAPYENDTDSGR